MSLGIIVGRKREGIGKFRRFFYLFERKIKYEKLKLFEEEINIAYIKGGGGEKRFIKKAMTSKKFSSDKWGVCKETAFDKEGLSKDIIFENEKEKKKFFLSLAEEVYIYLAERFSMLPQRLWVCIKDRRLLAADIGFLKKFCYLSSYLSVETEVSETARISEELFKERGLDIEISPLCTQSWDILIDVDDFSITSKDCCVNNFSFDFGERFKERGIDDFFVCCLLKDMGWSFHLEKVCGECAHFKILKKAQSLDMKGFDRF